MVGPPDDGVQKVTAAEDYVIGSLALELPAIEARLAELGRIDDCTRAGLTSMEILERIELQVDCLHARPRYSH